MNKAVTEYASPDKLNKFHWFAFKCLVTASAMVLSSGVQANDSGRLGHSSSGSIQIRLTTPEKLDVMAPESLSTDNVNATSTSKSWKAHTLCVQGNKIDHYSISVAGSSGKMVLSDNENDDIPYQVIMDDKGNKVILPDDGSGERLVLNTDSSCDNPSGINIDISDEEKLKRGNYSGAAMLKIGVE